MCKYEPATFEEYFHYVSLYERKFNTYFWDKPCDQIKKVIEIKWKSILEMEENQITIFDYLDELKEDI